MRCPEGQRFYASLNKIPTILLLNDKGAFHSFGHEAREAYQDLEESKAKKWLYFEKFKLELHIRNVRIDFPMRELGQHCLNELVISFPINN